MIMRNEDIEAMADIFQEYGISAPVEIIEKVASDFIDHLDAMRDMEMTPLRIMVVNQIFKSIKVRA